MSFLGQSFTSAFPPFPVRATWGLFPDKSAPLFPPSEAGASERDAASIIPRSQEGSAAPLRGHQMRGAGEVGGPSAFSPRDLPGLSRGASSRGLCAPGGGGGRGRMSCREPPRQAVSAIRSENKPAGQRAPSHPRAEPEPEPSPKRPCGPSGPCTNNSQAAWEPKRRSKERGNTGQIFKTARIPRKEEYQCLGNKYLKPTQKEEYYCGRIMLLLSP